MVTFGNSLFQKNIFNISISLSEFFCLLKSLAFQILVQAASFGGSNIDPTAWEDKKCKGELRFPAQVKVVLMILRTQFDIYLKGFTHCIICLFMLNK